MMKGIQETWLELVKSMMDFKFQIIIRMIIWFKYEMNYFFWVSFLSTCITIFIISCCIFSFPGGSADKESACNGETLPRSLGWENPLEKGKAIHSSILAWRIPWTVQSMVWQRVRHDWVTFTFAFLLSSHLSIISICMSLSGELIE